MKKQFFIIPLTLLIVLILTNQSCYYDSEVELYPNGTGTSGTCDTTNAKFATFVSPLIASKCATSGCHNALSASGGVNLSNYTTIKTYITKSKATFMGTIKHASGFSAMPQGGTKLAACDIQKLEQWIATGMVNN